MTIGAVDIEIGRNEITVERDGGVSGDGSVPNDFCGSLFGLFGRVHNTYGASLASTASKGLPFNNSGTAKFCGCLSRFLRSFCRISFRNGDTEFGK